MKITNVFGLPKVFENLAKKDSYSKGQAQYSVTELIAPPRIRVLQRANASSITRDVADLLWPLLGKTIHKILEDRAAAGSIPEQRLHAVVDGVAISGGIDLQVVSGDEVDIVDWKFTSTWALDADKKDWVEQLNVYAYLARLNGRSPRKLRITAILRDWSRAKAEADPTYPQAPVAMLDIVQWPTEMQDDFVKQRIKLHQQAHYLYEMGEPIPECTDEEKWMSESSWIIRRPAATRAIRVFKTQDEAREYFKEKVKANAVIEERKAEPIRCKRDYCNVAQWCSFGKQFHGDK